MPTNPTVSKSTTIAANDDCLSTMTNGESVILHVEEGMYYGFNQVGTDIWEFVQEPRTVDEICRDIQQSYDVDEERCLADVKDIVEEMLELDLVVRVNE